jgi:hypothetical protein
MLSVIFPTFIIYPGLLVHPEAAAETGPYGLPYKDHTLIYGCNRLIAEVNLLNLLSILV